MSDSGTARQRQSTAAATANQRPGIPEARRPHPVGMLVVDAVTGTVTAANPAGRSHVTGTSGSRLGRWLSTLATAADHPDDITTVRAWCGPTGTTTGTTTVSQVSLWAHCTAIDYRSRRCLLVVLREDGPRDGGAAGPGGPPTTDPTCAVFTLDADGRVDSWGPGARRWTGFTADHVIGSDTTLLHPGPARLAGEPLRALTLAYRTGEHRSEGWRVCGDGRAVWAEVTTCALYDELGRLLGFASAMSDLTARRRLVASASKSGSASASMPGSGSGSAAGSGSTAGSGWIPVPRAAVHSFSDRPADRPAAHPADRPAGRPAGRTRPGRVPGQRRRG